MSELTRGLEEIMLAPRSGFGVCRVCFNLTGGYRLCWACAHGGRYLDAFVPISYSVSGGPLHALLARYKRTQGLEARALEIRLAAVLWRHLARHERCIANAASVERFDVVTTVPSGDRDRDVDHPLRRVVGELAGPLRDRHRRVLRRSTKLARRREFDAARFEICGKLEGGAVLLVDDTWTTGSSAQSAAAALKAAGAHTVAAVVIGRYLNVDWRENRERLRAMPRPFRWERCALEPAAGEPGAVEAGRPTDRRRGQ